MPSFTSNSDPVRVPDLVADGRLVAGGWLATFALATVLALAALGGWEWRWRAQGYEPSVSSLSDGWYVVRDRVGGDAVALLGTSMMQSAVDPRILGQELNGRPVSLLAMINRSPLPVLEHLAQDQDYAGTVVMEVAPRIFFDGSGQFDSEAEAVVDGYLAYRASPGERAEARLALGVESSLVLRWPGFSLRRLVEHLRHGRDLQPPFDHQRRDRFRELDFDKVNLEQRRVHQATVTARSGRPPSQEEMAVLIARVNEAAHQIERRGGEVVLIALPTSGRARVEEMRRYPRADYWDVLVAGTGLPAIYSEDHAELADFAVADGLHLGREEAPVFTRALAHRLPDKAAPR